MIYVYIPPRAKNEQSLELLTDHIQDLETQAHDARIMNTGDLNRRNTTKALPGCQQNVTCATKGEATVDLLYPNVREAYTNYPGCPPGKSTICLIQFQPKYRLLVQRTKSERKNISNHGHHRHRTTSKPNRYCRQPPSLNRFCRQPPSLNRYCRQPPSLNRYCRQPPSLNRYCRQPPSLKRYCRQPSIPNRYCRQPPSLNRYCRQPPSLNRYCRQPSIPNRYCR